MEVSSTTGGESSWKGVDWGRTGQVSIVKEGEIGQPRESGKTKEGGGLLSACEGRGSSLR